MKTFTLVGLKGGAGRTTTAVNLAAAAKCAGHSALLVDLDLQGSATEYLMRGAEFDRGVGDALREPSRVAESLYETEEEFDILPTRCLPTCCGLEKINLDYLMGKLPEIDASESSQLSMRLKTTNAVKVLFKQPILQKRYDYAFVDTSARTSIISLSAYAYGRVLQPINLETPSIGQIPRTQKALKHSGNGEVPSCFVPIGYNPGFRQSLDVLELLHSHLRRVEEGGLVMPYIRQSQDVPQSYSEGQSVFAFDQHGRAASDYKSLFAFVEALDRMGPLERS